MRPPNQPSQTSRQQSSSMTIISLIVWIIVFCLVAYAMFWVCQKFGLPRPVWWVCGAFLLIVLLVFLLRQIGAPLSLTTPLR